MAKIHRFLTQSQNGCFQGAKRKCNASFSKSHNFMSAVLGLSGPFSDGFKRRAVDPERT